ncbi:hypothetical protein [Catonella massiliensis]|uniref:Uncharacterized protein n=1 Tax=Catonella massiliensis TaxID=2799636 RepID=A0ABS1J152_9FIRM|nr:hypothetical protein [Catonella massiliensis]MBK5897782.1 hypothetical protein [Catonella massiliensis]
MQNRETSFEKDPHLRRNDSLAQKSASNSGNKWAEAMKGVSSYSEHMRQVEARNAANKNAFKQASGKTGSTQSQANAFSRASSPAQNTSRTVSNNAVKSSSNTQYRSTWGTGQTTSAWHGQSASRSK